MSTGNILVWNCCLFLLGVIDSQQLGEGNERQPNSFRLQKFNFAWDKAKLRLNDAELEVLFVAMTKLDKQALKAKHDYTSGKDSDGSIIELMDRKFINLLKQYKLYDVIASLEDRRSKLDEESLGSDPLKRTQRFVDTKLNKLWEEAQKAGFDEPELGDLYIEFQHYESKLDSLKKGKEEFSNANPDDNQVTKNFDDNIEGEKLNRDEKFKLQNKAVEENLKRLMKKIEDEKLRSSNGEFTHPKVKFIWEKALNSQHFNELELNSIREELRHFESKLNKKSIVENELIKTEYKLNKAGKNHFKSLEHKQLEIKYKEYERKIEKLENYLKSKLIHTEL